jgi:hypothetical protein
MVGRAGANLGKIQKALIAFKLMSHVSYDVFEKHHMKTCET